MQYNSGYDFTFKIQFSNPAKDTIMIIDICLQVFLHDVFKEHMKIIIIATWISKEVRRPESGTIIVEVRQ